MNRRDINPIEMAFAKLRALLRKDPAQTIAALIERIKDMLDRIRPQECQSLFHAAGYQCSM